MTFDEVLDQVRELLESKGRVTYRSLKRRFELDEEYLEDLKGELIRAEGVAVDEDGDVLVWVGKEKGEETEKRRGREAEQAQGASLDAKPQPLTPRPSEGERRQLTVEFIDLVGNTLVYLTRSGCQWDRLPHDLLPKSTVSDYFVQWRDDGTWTTRLAAVREQVRRAAGREPTPRAACLESQSVQTTEVGGAERGYDGGKKIKGRKRHVLVATLGLLLAVLITSAPVDDGAAAPALLAPVSPHDCPRLETIFGDHKYHNPALDAWLAANRPGWRLAVKSRPPGRPGFTPVRTRWGVERTNAWNGRSRRNSKDYARTSASAAVMIQIRHLHLMLRKLAPSAQRDFHYASAA